MFQIYNKQAITRKQRFQNALIVGILTAAVCVLVFTGIFHFFRVYFGILFIVMGYAISFMIQRYGKGVQIQFAILSVVLTLLAIFVSDMIIYNGNISALLMILSWSGVDALWQIGYRILALITAYQNARIIN